MPLSSLDTWHGNSELYSKFLFNVTFWSKIPAVGFELKLSRRLASSRDLNQHIYILTWLSIQFYAFISIKISFWFPSNLSNQKWKYLPDKHFSRTYWMNCDYRLKRVNEHCSLQALNISSPSSSKKETNSRRKSQSYSMHFW